MAPKRDVRSRTSSSSASSSSRTLALSPSVRLPAAKRAVAKSKPTAKPAAVKVMKKVMKKKTMKAMKKVPARKPAGKFKAKAKPQLRRYRAVDLGNSSDSDMELSMADRRDERVSRIYQTWNDWAQYNRSFREPPPCSFEAFLAEQMTARGWSFGGNTWQKGHLNHMGPDADDDDDADWDRLSEGGLIQ